MVGIYDFNRGRRNIIDIINAVDSKPIMVAFYGMPDSGKSKMIEEEVGAHFKKRGLDVACGTGGPDLNVFEYIRDNPECHQGLFLFHCGWERILNYDGEFVSSYEDPGCLAEKILGRNVDLNVGIHNPNFEPYIEGEYDIIISNPMSIKKNP